MWIYIIVYIYIYILLCMYTYIYISHLPRNSMLFQDRVRLRTQTSPPPSQGAPNGRTSAPFRRWPLWRFGLKWSASETWYGYVVYMDIYIWILIHGIPSRKMWDVVLFWKIHGIYTRTNGFCKKKLGKTVGNLRTYRNFRVSNGEQMLLNNNWELRPTRNFRDVWRFHQHWLIHIHPSPTIVYSVAEKTLVSHVMNVYMCNVY